jgi:hypothetical protein
MGPSSITDHLTLFGKEALAPKSVPSAAPTTTQSAATAGVASTTEGVTNTGSHASVPVDALSASRLLPKVETKSSAPLALSAGEARTMPLVR